MMQEPSENQYNDENSSPVSCASSVHNVIVHEQIQVLEAKLKGSTSMTPGKLIASKSFYMTTPQPKMKPSNSTLSLASSIQSSPFSPTGSMMSTCSTTRESAKMAKLMSTAERIRQVSMLKEKWTKEKERKAMVNKEKREKELKKLQHDTEMMALQRKKALDKKKQVEQEEKDKEREMLADSLKTRSQLVKDLDIQAKARRRISIFVNSAIREKAKKKQAELELQQKQQEAEELSTRRIDFLQFRQNKVIEDMNRRESLVNRGLMSKTQKLAENEMLRKSAEEEASLHETRRLNWLDDNQAAQKAEQNRRESLMGRLDKWREEKAEESKQAEQKAIADAIERELEYGAYQDEVKYKASLEKQRRTSLAYRLDKARKDRTLEEGQMQFQAELEREELRIQALDREDMLSYRKMLQDQRRKSLQYRNQTEHQEKLRLATEKEALRELEKENFELSENAWRDVKAYQESQRAAARRSIAWRIADSQRQKEVDLKIHREQLEAMHMDFELKRLNHEELQTYRSQEKERSRKSIAMRLDSWRQHKVKLAKQKAASDLQKEEDCFLAEQDREALSIAKRTNLFLERQDLLTSSMIL